MFKAAKKTPLVGVFLITRAGQPLEISASRRGLRQRDETFRIITCDWIYMDTNYAYIAGVEYNGVEYLNFEEGLENMVDWMNKHKSLI